MRNWNSALYLTGLPLFGFQTTYEELKPKSVSSSFPLSTASRLPMRNWNFKASNVFCSTSNASRLPMRNWNFDKSSYLSIPLCFQTTYEELKPEVVTSYFLIFTPLPDYLWGIETLLVQAFGERQARWLPDYLWGIETCVQQYSMIYYYASRLPMRNWNYNAQLSQVEVGKASRLPMRNWNSERHLVGFRHLQASRLPMRNWNESRYPGGMRLRRFQTTYEELKLY